jgi:hypothetical protein
MSETEESDYTKYRGKCKQMSEAAIEADPTLTLVRGWYYDPAWGEQAHWWTKRPDSSIFDPTKDQFPSKGNGAYREFDGFYECEQCGISVEEAKIIPCGSYPCCSNRCAFALIGMSEYYSAESCGELPLDLDLDLTDTELAGERGYEGDI